MKRLLITGSRTWTDYAVIYTALLEYQKKVNESITVVHGGARGADYLAHTAAKRLLLFTEPHGAKWEDFGSAAGPIRNREMVESDIDVCFAFIRKNSKGATGCARMAEQAGIPTTYWRE
jgi:hypothetical protein